MPLAHSSRQQQRVYPSNMDLFYLPELDATATQVLFPKEESKHISRVLRKQHGDKLRATNGKGFEAVIELIQVNNHKVEGEIKNRIEHTPLPYQLHLAIAPTKNINRLEWFLEKATEIGIHSITPLLCEHSERKIIKPERLEKIIIAALKQSQNVYLPQLKSLQSFEDFIPQHPKGYIAHCHEGEKTAFFNAIEANGDITLLIGPEGDFSIREVEMALQHDYTAVSLGKQRLRTETAALVGCHTVALKAQ